MAQVDFCKISGEIALRLDNRPSMKLIISYGDGQRRGVCVCTIVILPFTMGLENVMSFWLDGIGSARFWVE